MPSCPSSIVCFVQEKLFEWRDCVVNYTDYNGDLFENGTICDFCKKPFNNLFSYYWDIYVEPGVEFCVDVETTVSGSLFSLYERLKWYAWSIEFSCYAGRETVESY